MKGRSALPRVAFLLGLTLVGAVLVSVVWGQRLLAKLSYFNVRRVEVVGTHWLAPDSLLALAALRSDRSVWEDYSALALRLAEHPLIEEAQIRRSGLRSLRIVVREVEPVAMVGVPELWAVRSDGTLLPIDPTHSPVDLPLLTVEATLNDDSTRLADGPALEALKVFAALHALDPGLTAVVSDFAQLDSRDYVLNLMMSQPARRIELPAEIDERLVRRLRATLADLRRRGIEAAVIEARYVDQIVVRREQA
jgi:cell division septal protein FtsQ